MGGTISLMSVCVSLSLFSKISKLKKKKTWKGGSRLGVQVYFGSTRNVLFLNPGSSPVWLLTLYFFKKQFYLCLERGGGKEKKRKKH